MGISVTTFLKRVNISKYFCSFKGGFNNAIPDASKLRLTYIKLPYYMHN